MANIKVPNWGQTVIAMAAGLEVEPLVVRHESDYLLTFLDTKSRVEYLIDKRNGQVSKH